VKISSLLPLLLSPPLFTSFHHIQTV
jgi:hypothetical protein